MDVSNPGNFHIIYLINLPPCFVQGSLIGGSRIILVPFWPMQPCEFDSREWHVSIVSFWAWVIIAGLLLNSVFVRVHPHTPPKKSQKAVKITSNTVTLILYKSSMFSSETGCRSSGRKWFDTGRMAAFSMDYRHCSSAVPICPTDGRWGIVFFASVSLLLSVCFYFLYFHLCIFPPKTYNQNILDFLKNILWSG